MEHYVKLSSDQGRLLIFEARKTIRNKLLKPSQQNESEAASPHEVDPILHKKGGTFVTLSKNGKLRGCIGHIIAHEPIVESIRHNAFNAAFKDPRFPPVSIDEFNDIHIEISVLTEPELMSYSNIDDLKAKLRPEIDGVIIQKENKSATFLPQVWKQLPDHESFLSHLCMKAGLSSSAWKNEKITVFTYQVQAFEE